MSNIICMIILKMPENIKGEICIFQEIYIGFVSQLLLDNNMLHQLTIIGHKSSHNFIHLITLKSINY